MFETYRNGFLKYFLEIFPLITSIFGKSCRFLCSPIAFSLSRMRLRVQLALYSKVVRGSLSLRKWKVFAPIKRRCPQYFNIPPKRWL